MISLDDLSVPPAILEPTSEQHVFVIQEPGQSNETARFELDDTGKVVKVHIRNEYTTKKS